MDDPSVMELALVDDADCLALGSGDGLGSHEMDLGADAQHGAHGALSAFSRACTSAILSENCSGENST